MSEQEEWAEWNQKVESIKDALWPEIESTLLKIKHTAKQCGYQTGTIEEESDEEHSWSVIVHVTEVPAEEVGTWHNTDLNVELTLSESSVAGDGEAGLNFRLEFTGDGGKEYRTVAPFNHTPECWIPVHDKAKLEERWRLVNHDSINVLEDVIGDMIEEHEQDVKRGLYGDVPTNS